ncbi:hypothetical protein [Flavobacterium sp. C4GT6]|uniref:hypothetical protein n=1 Tax=Flavobacterium sp. C4GT6 TaxID=3103818 RepID=UPI002ED36C0F
MRYLTGLLFLTFLVLASCRERTDFEKSLMANSWVYCEHETLDRGYNVVFVNRIYFDKEGRCIKRE